MRFAPLNNRLLLEKIESDKRGGLHIPQALSSEEQTNVTPTQRCVVIDGQIEVDDNARHETIQICAGAIVYIARHTGYTVEDADGRELLVVEGKDVLLLEEEEES